MRKFLKQQKNSVTSIEAEIVDLESRRNAVADRLAAAQTELEKAKVAQHDHMIVGDLTDEEASQKVALRVTIAQGQVDGYKEALASLDNKLADAKQRLEAEHDKIARDKAVKELHAKADAVDRKAAVARVALFELLESLKAIKGLPYQSPEFLPRMEALINELPNAASQLGKDARDYAAQIQAGNVDLPGMKKAEPPAPPPVLNDKPSGTFYGKHGRVPGEMFAGDVV
jgi:chromosome segregation ATPase